jgi:hypothetical protein
MVNLHIGLHVAAKNRPAAAIYSQFTGPFLGHAQGAKCMDAVA